MTHLSLSDWRHLLREDAPMLANEAGRRVSRPKSKFDSAREAWASIAKATGKTPADVIRKDHTDSQWAWVIKK